MADEGTGLIKGQRTIALLLAKDPTGTHKQENHCRPTFHCPHNNCLLWKTIEHVDNGMRPIPPNIKTKDLSPPQLTGCVRFNVQAGALTPSRPFRPRALGDSRTIIEMETKASSKDTIGETADSWSYIESRGYTNANSSDASPHGRQSKKVSNPPEKFSYTSTSHALVNSRHIPLGASFFVTRGCPFPSQHGQHPGLCREEENRDPLNVHLHAHVPYVGEHLQRS